MLWAGCALVILFTVSTTSGKLSPLGDFQEKFVCSSGRCTQAKFIKNAPANVTFNSMELCRLLCHKYGNLWPLPTLYANLGQNVVEINLDQIKVNYHTPDVNTENYLKNVVNLFKQTLVTECQGRKPTQPDVTLQVVLRIISSSLDLDLNTDETYKIIVANKLSSPTYNFTKDPLKAAEGNQEKVITAEINATTVYGIRHGLETLLQTTARQLQSDDTCSTVIIDKSTIKDRPIFKHRGVLIDSSRNYLPIRTIKRVIDAMASVKLNALHWHITDSHSFPLLLTKLPLLAKYGAYSSKEIYTPDDVKHLIAYAELRGVRIYMEIDTPAHAGNGWEFGEEAGLGKLVLCLNSEPWRNYCSQPPCGQLNPANSHLYYTLHNLYEEIQSFFPSKDIFHMGGDEVFIPCWNSSDEVVDYMNTLGIPRTTEGFLTLWSEFQKKALEAWDEAVGHNKTRPILWSSQLTNADHIEKYLDKKRYIIETWEGRFSTLPEDLLAKGYSVIYATRDTWYLDHGFWGSTTYHTWNIVYDYVIPEYPNVLGGEVSLWGELVDEDNIETKLWPRAAALAERLWTSPHYTSNEAESRLWETRQRLRRRGHKIDQIKPEWCYLNDGKC
uniref:Beta-hexosaminidase n=1 Tax=Pristhesancus plagipennis TaxID=1955184 RepID=A0A1Q1NPB5_PRIPG|nr:venom hexosaminidase-like protein 1 [Pristhesancus plagipennis]